MGTRMRKGATPDSHLRARTRAPDTGSSPGTECPRPQLLQAELCPARQGQRVGARSLCSGLRVSFCLGSHFRLNIFSSMNLTYDNCRFNSSVSVSKQSELSVATWQRMHCCGRRPVATASPTRPPPPPDPRQGQPRGTHAAPGGTSWTPRVRAGTRKTEALRTRAPGRAADRAHGEVTRGHTGGDTGWRRVIPVGPSAHELTATLGNTGAAAQCRR